MDSSRIVYLFIIHLAILIHLDTVTLAQPELIFHICSDSGNYTINSSYKENLDNVLSSFNTMQPSNGFFNGSVGQNTDKVNAVALCRGDVLPEECSTCVNASSYELTEVCPNQKEAIGWYDLCMLRYSNDSILGIVSGVTDYMWNKGNASNVVEFNKVLLDLLTKLKTQAASGGSLRKFATGDASYANNFGRVYALVQCTPDLSQLQCNNCLGDAFLFIPKYLDGLEEGRVFGASCNFRYDSSLFYNSTTTATKGKDSNTSKLVIIIVVPTVTSVILIVCVFFFVRKKKKPRDIAESKSNMAHPHLLYSRVGSISICKYDVENDIGTVESLQFNFDTIRVATDNFSHTNKLGQGGFGAVYKGTLPNGEDIAVKRLSVNSGQGDHEFKNEVLLVAKLQHRNLVRLRGFCLEGSERLLVYEFVPNTSLDHFIFDPIKRAQLDWERRYKIIGGIARGLLYLHEDSRLRIIHRDLKASNILLDAEMYPKIADFGMARLFVVDQTQGNTNRIVGTYGYMAPEYAMRGHFSVKSDVFSFGVLVLEIISGQKNNCFHNGQNVEVLVCYAWENWREGTAQNLIDPTLTGSRIEIMRCIHIGLLCVQENVAARPTMNSIVLMLNSYSLTLPVPSQPPFSTHSGMDPEMSLLSEVSESDQSKSRSDKCWMGVAPGFVRRARVDIQVKGYTIPAGWAILTANSPLHYNPNHQVAPTVWNNDCFHHTKPPSSSYLCSNIVFTLQPFLRILYS